MKNNLSIDTEKETKKITDFLEKTFQEQGIKNAVIGLSGGIDSAVSFYLLHKVLRPENIYIAHLYYSQPIPFVDAILKDRGVPVKNRLILSIQPSINKVLQTLKIEANEKNKIRIGNITARMRMIFLYDLAKKTQSLVCGTENRSENLLGYFTRFGDQASDIDPIVHLFKTQVFQLARFLEIPEIIIKQEPTAGLWAGQTDEGEFGFTYKEADQVLHLHFDQHLPLEEIQKKGFKNAPKIITYSNKNKFKRITPYHL